jgi:hypothetical protein
MQFPDDEHGFAMEDQVYLGDTGILIHPVVHQGAETVKVYISEAEVLSPIIILTRLIMITLIIKSTKGGDTMKLPCRWIKSPSWFVGEV